MFKSLQKLKIILNVFMQKKLYENKNSYFNNIKTLSLAIYIIVGR